MSLMKSISQVIKVLLAKASAQLTASGTGSVIIDVKNYKSVCFALYLTAVGAADADNTMTFSVQEGDSALGYDMADITDTGRVQDTFVCNSTAFAGTVQKIGVSVGTKRYMRLKWTEVGTADVTLTSLAVLGGANELPVD